MIHKKAFILIILSITFLYNVKGQEFEKPILAIRNVTSWGPDYTDFFPEVAIYKSGTVLIKLANDSSTKDRMTYFKIYKSSLPKNQVDSIIKQLPIKDFYELKDKYSPFEEQRNIRISDAGIIYVSVLGNENKTKNVQVYNTFAENDKNYTYNPKAAKIIYDKLSQLRDSIVKTKDFRPWTPEKMEVFFYPYSKEFYSDSFQKDLLKPIKWPKDFPKPNSQNSYSVYDISGFKSEREKKERGITISAKEQIDFIIKNCRSEYRTVDIDGKKWIIKYSFTADNCKFVDYVMYKNCM